MKTTTAASSSRPIVSVLTPSLPERHLMLLECEASVQCQTADVWEHLIEIDAGHAGCASTINQLAAAASGDWLLPLADDDLLLPGCLDHLLFHCDNADIVYSPPLVNGNEDRWWFFQAPPLIPSCALIRKTLWVELGGYDETLKREEDRAMWTKAVAVGARFVRVDQPCWVYRQHASNKSFATAAA